MRVHLPDGYYFDVGKDSFDLFHKNPEKKSATFIGYITSMPRLLNRVIQHMASNTNAEADMMGFLEYWKKMQERLIEVLKEYKLEI